MPLLVLDNVPTPLDEPPGVPSSPLDAMGLDLPRRKGVSVSVIFVV